MCLLARLEISSYHGEANHHTKLTSLSDSLQYTILAKSNIEQTDLKPQEPKNTEKSCICFQCGDLVDFMRVGKSGKISDEEKIVEEFKIRSLLISSEYWSLPHLNLVKTIVLRNIGSILEVVFLLADMIWCYKTNRPGDIDKSWLLRRNTHRRGFPLMSKRTCEKF